MVVHGVDISNEDLSRFIAVAKAKRTADTFHVIRTWINGQFTEARMEHSDEQKPCRFCKSHADHVKHLLCCPIFVREFRLCMVRHHIDIFRSDADLVSDLLSQRSLLGFPAPDGLISCFCDADNSKC
jgi:hypothetical protein